MTYIDAITHTTFNHAPMTLEEKVTEDNYPTLHRLLSLYSGSRPNHPALMLTKDFFIPRSFNRQLKIIECLLYQLTDEELRCLCMLRGFEAYARVVNEYHLYLVEAFLNEMEI